MKQPAIYILTNQNNTTLYTGVTSNLMQRIYQHKEEITTGFSSKYKCKKLIYYEVVDDMEVAIVREKQLKNYNRKKKIALVTGMNPNWNDLYLSLV